MAKRRKGKQSSGRSTPSSATPPQSAPASEAEEEEDSQEPTSEPESSKDEEMKEEPEQSPKKEEKKEEKPKKAKEEPEENSLVLTSSEKRRGVYECDYCHSDISQLPRIRCAICPDFDLCLDCFSTTDHQAAIARLKAAASTHSELSKDGIQSTMVTGISVSSQNGYPLSQGYKVCDSTRYSMFGPTKHSVVKAPEENDQESKPDEEMTSEDSSSLPDILTMPDDPKVVWTVEEDLRLLDGIKTHGLGNWTEISETVSGNGSSGKTPKRCMERYLDDFLGRYGYILPPYTIIDDAVEDEVVTAKDTNDDAEVSSKPEEEEAVRSSKRRVSSLSRLPSNVSTASRSRKRYRVARTETLPEYTKMNLKPFVPEVEGVEIGQEVCREQSKRAENDFVKATADVSTKAEADKIKEEWIATRMNRPGAPTVLPPRPCDTAELPGADLLGFMPRRGDFDTEWANEAEESIADMEFLRTDTPQEKQLKVQVLEIYFQKQEERERRKNFIMTRKLYDYKKFLEDEEKIPVDERDLVQRLRLFERFHTPEEHKLFIADITKAKKLRKEIAKLQMYRRIGIRTLLEAEKYELDKERRQFHKAAQMQREAEAKNAAMGTQDNNPNASTATAQVTDSKVEDALWKQYKQNDRRGRRSINRTVSSLSEAAVSEASEDKTKEEKVDEEKKIDETKEEEKKDDEKKEGDKEASDDSKPMNVDQKDADVEMKDAEDENTDKEKTTSPKKGDSQEEDEFDISTSKGYDLLSKREIQLCLKLQIYPVQYLEIKKALIFESMKKGLLDSAASGSARRTIVKVDVEKRGNIIDFMVRAGWISTSLGKAAQSITSEAA